MKEEVIRDFTGWILGRVETKPNGDKVARLFSGIIVGYYYKDRDVTTDFYGRIVGRGDSVVALIYQNQEKNR